MFRTVSIMPGMDWRAPERQETSSGFSGSPYLRPIFASTRAKAAHFREVRAFAAQFVFHGGVAFRCLVTEKIYKLGSFHFFFFRLFFLCHRSCLDGSCDFRKEGRDMKKGNRNACPSDTVNESCILIFAFQSPIQPRLLSDSNYFFFVFLAALARALSLSL